MSERSIFEDLTFGERLKLARKYNNIKDIQEIADKADVPAPSWYQYESGRISSVRAARLKKISVALGISSPWLATGKGYPIESDPDSLDKFLSMLESSHYGASSDEKLLAFILTECLHAAESKHISEEDIAKTTIRVFSDVKGTELSTDLKYKVARTAVDVVLRSFKAKE